MKRAVGAGLALGWALAGSALIAQAPEQQVAQAPGQQVGQQVAPAPAQPVVQPTSPQADVSTPTAPARVTFQLERAGVVVPRFLLAIDEDGSAGYAADQVLPSTASRGGSTDHPPTQHVEQKVVLTHATTLRIFQLARSLDRFNVACASLAKNVTDMGKKTLSYSGPDGAGSCAYNFSENKNVVALTVLLQGIVTTLDLGRKLDFDHRFDRLGLDDDTATLVEAVDEGRAIELGVIARTLRSIAEDSQVLQRVRGRAASLLQRFPPAS